MNTAFDILVIALSCLLGIFLILSIIMVALIMKLVNSLRKVVAKGEQLVDSAEVIGETLRANAAAFNVAKLIAKFVGGMSANKHRR